MNNHYFDGFLSASFRNPDLKMSENTPCKFAPNCTLRGEVGMSEMKTRMVKGIFQNVKTIGDRKNNY